MDFYEVIKNRESIREYDREKTIDRAILKRILDAGRIAPSACNRQPWRFLVISSKEMLIKMHGCYRRTWFAEAPHVLVVVGNKQESWVRETDGFNSLETDLAIAMDHLILAAENEGVGTCWISSFKPDLLRKVLQLKDDEAVYTLTPLGYPKEGYKKNTAKERKNLDQIVQFL